jgi:hypothetical protein
MDTATDLSPKFPPVLRRVLGLMISSAEPVSLPTAFPAKLTPSEEDRPDGTC